MYSQLRLDSVESGEEVVGILNLYTAIAEYALCSGSGLQIRLITGEIISGYARAQSQSARVSSQQRVTETTGGIRSGYTRPWSQRTGLAQRDTVTTGERNDPDITGRQCREGAR